MGPRLAGKVALVTGAGREGGLGEAICLRLAAEGAAVLVTDIAVAKENLPLDRTGSREDIERVVASIVGLGGRAAAAALDVRDETQVIAAVNTAVKYFGGLDIIINNAGVGYLMEPIV